MTMSVTEATKAVFDHHLEAVLALDLDGIVSDYVEESIILSQGGVAKGLEQVRFVFSQAVNSLSPEIMKNFHTINLEIEGEFVYIVWQALPLIPFSVDTLCIRNGKIIMQSITSHWAS